VWPWARLAWEQPITARDFLLYPRPSARDPLGEFELYLSDGQRLRGRSDPQRPNVPILVTVPTPGPIHWAHPQLTGFPNGHAPGLAELTVAGDPARAQGAAPPQPPPSVTLTAGSLRLSWTRSPSPTVIGCKIFAGRSPDALDLEWDAGNAASYQPEYLNPNEGYWFQIRAYDASRFGPPQAREVSGVLVPPRIDRIVPDSGPTWGETEVRYRGRRLRARVQVKIGDQYVPLAALPQPRETDRPHLSPGGRYLWRSGAQSRHDRDGSATGLPARLVRNPRRDTRRTAWPEPWIS
jgi:hypothetical protein